MPGVFDFQVEYVYSGGRRESQSGKIDLSKFARVSTVSNSSSKVVVCVAGLFNNMEHDMDNLGPTSINPISDAPFSIASYLNHREFKVYYFAQGNANGVRANAYSLLLALEKINADVNPSEISIIAHSKGGLETNAMLCSEAKEFGIGPSVNYSGSSIYNKLKRVVYLGTPHDGAPTADFAEFFNFFNFSKSQSYWANIPAIYDLQSNDRRNTLPDILKNGVYPSHVKFFNLSGWGVPEPSWVARAVGDNLKDAVFGSLEELFDEDDFFAAIFTDTDGIKNFFKNLSGEFFARSNLLGIFKDLGKETVTDIGKEYLFPTVEGTSDVVVPLASSQDIPTRIRGNTIQGYSNAFMMSPMHHLSIHSNRVLTDNQGVGEGIDEVFPFLGSVLLKDLREIKMDFIQAELPSID